MTNDGVGYIQVRFLDGSGAILTIGLANSTIEVTSQEKYAPYILVNTSSTPRNWIIHAKFVADKKLSGDWIWNMCEGKRDEGFTMFKFPSVWMVNEEQIRALTFEHIESIPHLFQESFYLLCGKERCGNGNCPEGKVCLIADDDKSHCAKETITKDYTSELCAVHSFRHGAAGEKSFVCANRWKSAKGKRRDSECQALIGGDTPRFAAQPWNSSDVCNDSGNGKRTATLFFIMFAK